MLDSILSDLKDQIAPILMEKVGLSSGDVDKTVSIAGESLQKTVTDETTGGGLSGLLNLFSDDDNNDDGDNLMGNLGSNFLTGLIKGGFDSEKAGEIQSLVLPMLIKMVSSKVGGNSSILSSLLGGGGGSGGSGFSGAAGSAFKKLF